jgi:hypothetical protein
MSELDFDELDKAVNTLMNDVPKAEPSKTDEIKTLTIKSTLTDESRPSFDKLDSALAEVNGADTAVVEKPAVSSPARASTPSLATRRGGRFMDVVHPSSDMKTATKSALPRSRQGVTIEPIGKLVPEKSDDQSDAIASVVNDAPMRSNTPVEIAEEATANVDHNAAANDWPDPLEMSEYTPAPKTNDAALEIEELVVGDVVKVVKDELPVNEPSTIFPVDDHIEFEDPQSLTSPFIADAKVEKRPLGGAPTDATVDEPDHAPVLGVLAVDSIATELDPADQLPPTPNVVETHLPPELQSDLMAIETDGGTAASTAKAVEDVEVTPAAAPVVETQKAPDVAEPVVESKPVATEAATVSGPTSISQQYHEEPSTSDESNGSIYDTDSYHQPLAHPAKTKSGWLWIIWILLLLIAGGGGAVALYFLGII